MRGRCLPPSCGAGDFLLPSVVSHGQPCFQHHRTASLELSNENARAPDTEFETGPLHSHITTTPAIRLEDVERNLLRAEPLIERSEALAAKPFDEELRVTAATTDVWCACGGDNEVCGGNLGRLQRHCARLAGLDGLVGVDNGRQRQGSARP